MRPRLSTLPLFLQALGLVIATLIASQLVTSAVILLLPPPNPDIYTLGEIAQALETGQGLRTKEGRPLKVEVRDHAPPPSPSYGRAMFGEQLAKAMGLPRENVVIARDPNRVLIFRLTPRPAVRADPDEPLLFNQFEAAARQPNGDWRVVMPQPVIGLDAWQQRVVIILALAALAIAPLAWWFSRRLAAPLSDFAAAAERLGRDPHAPPADITGPMEVQAAAKAFNEMQGRLQRYVADRTSMIGAVAHDLRTPLTRLRFRVESAPEELRAKLVSDIDQMDAMISATLAFVSGASKPTERRKLELSSLIESVIDEAAETGKDAAVERADRVVLEGDPIALRRMVTNLIDNAVKYGGKARGRVFVDQGVAVLEVDDDGPGVAESELEKVFEPFYRCEASRNRETGGIGLGLAVVRAVARGHGGDVALVNRPGGGLTARAWLPI